MSDPILLWNEVAIEANRISHTNGQGEQAGPPLSARALAIVHLAMYDAFAGVINNPSTMPPYLGSPATPAGTSTEQAVAGAAYTTLSKLFPSQKSYFDSILAAVGDTSDASFGFGVDVGDAHIADRMNDPGVGSATYKPSPERCRHRPDPDNPGQGFHAPDYGRLSQGFGITQRFELAKPPSCDCNDAEYLAALKEVRGLGIKPELIASLPPGIRVRTTNETLYGIYWAYDGSFLLGTPPRQYNQIIRLVAKSKHNTPADNARLFAMANMAMADAGILSWDQKYIHDLWRPVVGIREHDVSMGPKTMQGSHMISGEGDPTWLPLGAPNSNRLGKNVTPNFPSYPSGHATFGAAAFHTVRLFYGQGGTLQNGDLGPDALLDKLDFVSEEWNGVTTDNTGTVRPRHVRKFPEGLWQMIEENGRSRVALGVHWVFDAFVVDKKNEPEFYRTDSAGNYYGGVPLGLLIAEDLFAARGGLVPQKSNVGPRPALIGTADERTPTHASSYL